MIFRSPESPRFPTAVSPARPADPPPAADDREHLHEVAAQFEALLFKEAFAPLSKAIGFYGDSVIAAAAQAMTRSAGAGLTDPLEAAMSSAVHDGAPR